MMKPINSAAWEWIFIERQRVARLATVDKQGQPSLVPIVFAFDGRRLYTPIDAKPKRVAPQKLQRVRNIQADPHVAVLFDLYAENWQRLAWVQLHGLARFVESGPEREIGMSLLIERYTQYTASNLAGRPVIVIMVGRITSWRAAG